MASTAASTIPPELFQRILFYLRGRWGSWELLGWAESKHELSSCAQTCWYWAQYCRPALFHTIALRSREDLQDLLALASSSDSILCDRSCSVFVKELMLDTAIAPDPPWLHLVFLSKEAFPKINRVSLSLHGVNALPGVSRGVTSVHPSLPRSFPPALSRCDSVTLRDIHLEHFEQLPSIIRSVSYLTSGEWLEPSYDKTITPEIHLRGVLWSNHRSHIVCPRRYPHTSWDAEYDVQDCTESWLLVRLLVTTRPWDDDIVGKRRIPLPYVDPGELGKLEGMLCCITDNAVGELHHDGSNMPPTNCGKFIFERGEVQSSKSGFTFSIRCSSLPACTPSVAVTVSSAGLITKFCLSFGETFSQNHSSADLGRDYAGFPWQNLDESASMFGERIPLVLVQVFADRASVAALAEVIAKKTPLLGGAGKLKFAFGGPERWRQL